MVRLLGYEPVAGRLLVERDGHVRTYLSVPLETFIGFRFASRPDQYFADWVAGRFVCC